MTKLHMSREIGEDDLNIATEHVEHCEWALVVESIELQEFN